MTWDETDGWIFSDEAHAWMNDLPTRRGDSPLSGNYRNGYGKEFGMFGFKELTSWLHAPMNWSPNDLQDVS